MTTPDPSIVDHVRSAAASDRYAAYLRNTLLELVGINTAAEHDLAATAGRERRLFDFIAGEVADLAGPDAAVEIVPIPPSIASDDHYTPPRYAAGADGAVPSAEQVYADRGNLVVTLPGANDAAGAILHAHVDVVPPWFAPASTGNRVTGRGACDNKAQVAVLLAQMKLFREMEEQLGVKPRGRRVYQFAIDEEIGGNGSLALALDARYQGLPVLLHECTDLVPYCAHRGAVWYRCRLHMPPSAVRTGSPAGSVTEMFPFVVLALEEEGRRLQQETSHPLFTAAHVQSCPGVLGPFGSSPSRVCDRVTIEITAKSNANPARVGMKITEFMEDALAGYLRTYGDKTRETDPLTGGPKVERHFELQVVPREATQNFIIDVFGRSGHMAASDECDNAIIKAATMMAALIRLAGSFPNVQATGALVGHGGDGHTVILEGGQGFTPSHTMADVQQRMNAAAREGARQYCRLRNVPYSDAMVELNFDRLHNDAYADAPDCAPMAALQRAFAATGTAWPAPRGWATSCDARIYHHKGSEVAIFGAGKLEVAHSEGEYVDVPDMQEALAISTLATWALVG